MVRPVQKEGFSASGKIRFKQASSSKALGDVANNVLRDLDPKFRPIGGGVDLGQGFVHSALEVLQVSAILFGQSIHNVPFV